MSKNQQKDPGPGVVGVAKRREAEANNEPTRLSTGVWARVLPVPASLIDEARASVPDPDVPVVEIPEKGRSEPNPNDPEYLKAVAAAERKREQASYDAMVLFGLELVDEEGNPTGAPEDNGWVKKLQYLHRRTGSPDLDQYDLDDPLDREFAYKKYIATSVTDIRMILRRSGVTQEAIEQASDSFRNN